MTNLLAQVPEMVWSLCEITGAPPQLSVASTEASLAAGTAPAHWTVTSAGMLVITGAVLSLTVMVWVWLLLLPQASVAVYARLMTNLLAQAPGVVWSVWVITGVPPQASVATTAALLATGTAPAQFTVTSPGILVIVGGVVSLTVIV